jgi:hypothetical protein
MHCSYQLITYCPVFFHLQLQRLQTPHAAQLSRDACDSFRLIYPPFCVKSDFSLLRGISE